MKHAVLIASGLLVLVAVTLGLPCMKHKREEAEHHEEGQEGTTENSYMSNLPNWPIKKPLEQLAGQFQGHMPGHGHHEESNETTTEGKNNENPMTSYIPDSIKKPLEEFQQKTDEYRGKREDAEEKPESSGESGSQGTTENPFMSNLPEPIKKPIGQFAGQFQGYIPGHGKKIN